MYQIEKKMEMEAKKGLENENSGDIARNDLHEHCFLLWKKI